MRRPCEILNLRLHVHWVWAACTSFNLEWNCSNIHAIVYYERFFHTTSSFRHPRGGKMMANSCWQIYNFSSLIPIISLLFCCEGEIIGWEAAYFVCLVLCSRHLSALARSDFALDIGKGSRRRRPERARWEKCLSSKRQFFTPYLFVDVEFK